MCLRWIWALNSQQYNQSVGNSSWAEILQIFLVEDINFFLKFYTEYDMKPLPQQMTQFSDYQASTC